VIKYFSHSLFLHSVSKQGEMQDEIDAFLGLERKINIPANVPANLDANVPANVDAIVEEKNEQKTTNYRDILAVSDIIVNR
jgi:hypothetical protein